VTPKRQQPPAPPPTVELDADPPVYEPGHPWHGLQLRPAYVRSRDEDGVMRWVYRPHVENA
jgi:hypothetical protein